MAEVRRGCRRGPLPRAAQVPTPGRGRTPPHGAWRPAKQVILHFFDELKSKSKGYASMEYKAVGFRPNNLVKLDIAINDEVAPPLATIVHADAAYAVGKRMTLVLKDLLPRQQFKVHIQARIGTKVGAVPARCPAPRTVELTAFGRPVRPCRRSPHRTSTRTARTLRRNCPPAREPLELALATAGVLTRVALPCPPSPSPPPPTRAAGMAAT